MGGRWEMAEERLGWRPEPGPGPAGRTLLKCQSWALPREPLRVTGYHRTGLALRRLDLDGAGAALGGELTQSGRQCKKLTQ